MNKARRERLISEAMRTIPSQDIVPSETIEAALRSVLDAGEQTGRRAGARLMRLLLRDPQRAHIAAPLRVRLHAFVKTSERLTTAT